MRVKEIVTSDAGSLDSLISLGALKSELAGMQFASNLPEMMLESLTDEINEILLELEGEEDV